MKKILLVLLCVVMAVITAQAQYVKDDIVLEISDDSLTITFLDKSIDEYDLLIYKSFEEIKINETRLTENPVRVYIRGWEPALYHIKIDYNLVTQFRHIEL